MGDPRYIILDEPTIGLNPVQVVEVRALVRQLVHGHTALISSHILSEIELVCDHIVMIARGRVVASGTPAELFRGRTWPDFEPFKADLDDFVVHWNMSRRQVKLKGLTPEEFRRQSLAT